MDKILLQEFMDIYPWIENHNIQTFSETPEAIEIKNKQKSDPLAQILPFNKDWLNQAYKIHLEWGWVFFSVNPMTPWKRDQKSVTWVTAWICEMDNRTKEEQKKLIKIAPIKPTFIVESERSYHLYWISKDWTKENRNKIGNGLRNFFDWDPAVVDISRVLRLPWFEHQKNPNNKFMIKLELDYELCSFNTENKEEDMLEAYPDHRKLSEIKREAEAKERVLKSNLWDDTFRDRVKAMDTETLLRQISWTKLVNWENIEFIQNSNWTKQIEVNGKSTGSWIDKNWKIGSYDWGWPNWTNRVFRYWNVDWKWLYSWIKDNYPEMLESKWIKTKEVKIVKEEMWDIDFTKITPYTRGLESLDNSFGRFDNQKLIVTVWESQSWKTEFTFFQARKNADKWHKVCYLALEMNKKNMILRIAMKRNKITKAQRDNKDLSEEQKHNIRELYQKLWNYTNLNILHLSSPTIDNIITEIEEKHKEWYTLFYVDNLWFIAWEWNEFENTTEAIRKLKDITNKHELTINLIHHFNKWNTQERNTPRGIASIRGSGKIENDVDYAMQVWRDLDPDLSVEEKSKVTILLQKDRERGDPQMQDIKFNRWDYIELEKTHF